MNLYLHIKEGKLPLPPLNNKEYIFKRNEDILLTKI